MMVLLGNPTVYEEAASTDEAESRIEKRNLDPLSRSRALACMERHGCADRTQEGAARRSVWNHCINRLILLIRAVRPGRCAQHPFPRPNGGARVIRAESRQRAIDKTRMGLGHR